MNMFKEKDMKLLILVIAMLVSTIAIADTYVKGWMTLSIPAQFMKKFLVILLFALPSITFANDFSGFYIGANISNDKNEFNLVSKTISTGEPYGWRVDSDDTDLSFGLNTGFNKIIDSKILLGIEVGYNHSDNNQKKDGICHFNNGDWSVDTFSYPVKFTNEKDMTIAGRFGYLLTPKTLIYISGGIAKAWMKADYFNETGTSITDTESKSFNGIRHGVGFEYFLWDHLSLQGSFAQTNFKAEDFLKNADSNYELSADYNTIDIDTQSLSIGINYHF